MEIINSILISIILINLFILTILTIIKIRGDIQVNQRLNRQLRRLIYRMQEDIDKLIENTNKK